MIKIGRYGLSYIKKTKGDFGIAREETRKIKTFFEGSITTFKTIERYSNDGNLLCEFYIASSLNDLRENFNLIAQMKWDTYNSTLMLDFQRYYNEQENNNINYYLGGDFCSHGIGEDISVHIYNKAKNEIIEMCNPDIEYGDEIHSPKIDNIIDLLRQCNSEEMETLLTYWDKIIVSNREKGGFTAKALQKKL